MTTAVVDRRETLTSQPSAAARQRMLSHWGEPLFLAGWRRVLMMHFEVDATALQRDVPFQLHLHHNRAFVSLVAFSMESMRPRLGGRLAARIFQPIATHDFLNARTYVVHNGEPGIHFLTEWLNNSLAVMLGPRIFSLPYRHGQITYDFSDQSGLRGCVIDKNNKVKLVFHGELRKPRQFLPCETGSLTEWLMERYTAFNSVHGCRRYFRVWHPPWPQCAANIQLDHQGLLTKTWPWFGTSQLVGANYSEGFNEVWMGRPHKL